MPRRRSPRPEDTGLHVAFNAVQEAYADAPEDERDAMFVGELRRELLEELRNPGCEFVEAGRACQEPAEWFADPDESLGLTPDRALCPKHTTAVRRRRVERSRREARLDNAQAELDRERRELAEAVARAADSR